MRMSPKAHRSPTDLLWWSRNPKGTYPIQRYTKGIQKAGNFFGTTFGMRKLFSKKIPQAGSD